MDTEARAPEIAIEIEIVALRQALTFLYDTVRMLLIMSTAAHLLILFIVCSNVSNLIVVRNAERNRELAVRLSQGATRGRLIRLLLTEGLILALFGGLLGIGVAWVGSSLAVTSIPEQLLLTGPIGLDGRALIFNLVLAVATLFLVQLAPAIRSTKLRLVEELKEGSSQGGDRRAKGLRQRTIMHQIISLVVLLILASLVVRSFQNMKEVDPGFETKKLLTMEVDFPLRNFPTVPRSKRS